MKRLALVALISSLTGLSCDIPRRTHTFIPPTNERDLCITDTRFFYSPSYDYCFRYPSDAWQTVQFTGERETGITATTANTFYLPTDTSRDNLFTLFVGPNNERTRTAYTTEGIIIVHEHPRYMIGYSVDPSVATTHPALAQEIPSMVDSLFFFSPDGTRQAEEPSL